MIVILETSAIISHLLTKGPSYSRQIILLAKNNKLKLVVSTDTLNELKIKIAKPKIKNYSVYNSRIIGEFIAWYQHNSFKSKVDSTFISKELRDSNDNIFLQIAIASKAKYLISVDKDLLTLKTIGATKIVTPKEFVSSEFPQL